MRSWLLLFKIVNKRIVIVTLSRFIEFCLIVIYQIKFKFWQIYFEPFRNSHYVSGIDFFISLFFCYCVIFMYSWAVSSWFSSSNYIFNIQRISSRNYLMVVLGEIQETKIAFVPIIRTALVNLQTFLYTVFKISSG